MEGDLDSYDPWKVGERVKTKGACTAFRSFQGWLALSAQGPGDGTLEVVPLLPEALGGAWLGWARARVCVCACAHTHARTGIRAAAARR